MKIIPRVILVAFYSLGLVTSAITSEKAPSTTRSRQPRALSSSERVAYQHAIEEVYWRHRIWPKENLKLKPSLDAVMSQAQLEKKVEDYLRDSQVLEDYWQKPITAEQLQAEMNRMARDTKQPEVLRELFAALGNDPFVIAECLARPVLSERLLTSLAQEKRNGRLALPQAGANSQRWYTLPTISYAATGCTLDNWTATNTINSPSPRYFHTAVWTGSEMIVWGGSGGSPLDTGGRYNPSTDSWSATSTANAPEGRYYHTAVWTGTEMIIWGGHKAGIVLLNTGGRYNPTTDSWTATDTVNAPSAREQHTAVWTGSEMIVWGGVNQGIVFTTGGRYNPNTDSWTFTSTINAPSLAGHTAVWTGSEMIVWGGYVNYGGKYNPSTDTWTSTSTINAPQARHWHTAVWTGTEMIIWGGQFENTGALNTGGSYNPKMDSWTATSTDNAPSGRYFHTAVWTGNEMIVWGGLNENSVFDTGGKYNLETNSWTATSTTNPPAARNDHTAVWSGSEMIVWGGLGASGSLNTGGRYCALSGPTPTPTPQLLLQNISTRGQVESGDNVLIGGFIITGGTAGTTKQVAVRAIGPSLTGFGVSGALTDPTLELHETDPTGHDVVVATNDNWKTNSATDQQIISDAGLDMFGSPPVEISDLESIIIADLPTLDPNVQNSGRYTAIIRGVGILAGIALVEVYDLDDPTTTTTLLGNISTRGLVGTGDNIMIGGIIVGPAPKSGEVVLRAIGPSLPLSGTLQDPSLDLKNANGDTVASNDDWQDNDPSIVTELQNLRLAPADRAESAIVATLTAGSYTAIVNGVNDTTGIALVEAYDINN